MTEVLALDLDFDFINHLADPQSLGVLVAERFKADLLQDELAVKVFEYQLEHLRRHGAPATGSVLEDTFAEVTIEEPLTSIDDLIERLRARYIRNEGRSRLVKLSELAVKDPLSVSAEMMETGRYLSGLTAKRGEVFGSGDFDRLIKLYDRKVIRGRGPSLGFNDLDEHFYGQQGLTFLIAAPKTYKSWLTVNAVVGNVIEGKYPYLYSLELPAHETSMRIRHLAAGVPWWRYLKNAYTDNCREQLAAGEEALNGMGVHQVEKPPQGQRGAYEMVQRARDGGAGIIYFDQLQYMEARNGHSLGSLNDTKFYFEVINDLRDLSDDGPIFVVHQFNRSVMNIDKMPEMQQVKGSSAIEEVGTLALGVWANKDMRRSNIVELGTLLSRNYNYAAWEVKVDLSKDCRFTVLGPSE